MHRYREKWTACGPCARFMDGRSHTYPSLYWGLTQRPFWKAKLDRTVPYDRQPSAIWERLRERSGEYASEIYERRLFAFQRRWRAASEPAPKVPESISFIRPRARLLVAQVTRESEWREAA